MHSASSRRLAISTQFMLSPSQPKRIFAVTGTGTAWTTAAAISASSGGFSSMQLHLHFLRSWEWDNRSSNRSSPETLVQQRFGPPWRRLRERDRKFARRQDVPSSRWRASETFLVLENQALSGDHLTDDQIGPILPNQEAKRQIRYSGHWC